VGPKGCQARSANRRPDGCANYLLPQVIAQICDANPGLEVQIVALPRVFNLSKREADMAISVSAPTAGGCHGAEAHRLSPASGRGFGRLSGTDRADPHTR
jgi:DNA-binding transcriptional LysR family regulator